MKTSNKTYFRIRFMLPSGLVLACSLLGAVMTSQATLIPVASAPVALEHMVLLPDGTVLAAQLNSSNWYRLTPYLAGAKGSGHYSSGTWTTVAPMRDTRSSFSSAVLRDGRLFVAGSAPGFSGTATAEIYNPSNNTWTVVSPPASVLDPTQNSPNTGSAQGIYDAECKVLPDGRVLLLPRAPMVANGTLLYDPIANSWSSGPPTLHYAGEAGGVKLPDGSVLIVDYAAASTERFLPALNIWTNDAPAPRLWASDGSFNAEGPSFLLPNGQAVFFGGTPEVGVYTPSGNNSPGTWTLGTTYPSNNSTAGGPGAMMVDGNILIAASQYPITITLPPKGLVGNPTTNLNIVPQTIFYRYISSTGTLTNTGMSNAVNCSANMMLDLPDGTVLLGVIGAVGSGQLLDYDPADTPLTAGKPIITGFSTNADGSLHLTGALFNGISEGAAYGAQHQMATDFPLVRFTSASGLVRYGRTYNWSTAGVMTGGTIVSTDLQPPAGWSGSDLIQVVANGIASDYLLLNLVVTNLNDSGAGSLRQILANSGSGSTIRFAPGLSGQTITLNSGPLVPTGNVTIDASALPGGIQLNGNHNSAILSVGGSVSVALNALTLTNAYDPAIAGGAIVNDGSLTVSNCTLVNNSSPWGGALENYGACELVNCTLTGNSSQNYGGAIDNVSGTLTLLECTVYGNSSSIGGGVDNDNGTVTVANSIVASNSGQDVYTWNTYGITYVNGMNIVSTPILPFPGMVVYNGGQLVTDPMLGPLTNNGGPTPTMLPQFASPAIDGGDPATAAGDATDQRGFARVVGPAPDIGAVEYQEASPVVTNTADSGVGSLRYASIYSPAGSFITFATNLSGQTITVSNGPINLYQQRTIDASGLPGGIQLNGNHSSRVFNVAGGANITLNALTLTNGYEPTDAGGAIVDYGTLTLNNCTFAGNSCGWGGAIENYGSSALVNCTLTGNSAQNYGGAIDNVAGTLTLLQCTICSNACNSGGGVDNYYYGSVSLANCIVAWNVGMDIYTWSNSVTYVEGTNIVSTPIIPLPFGYVVYEGAQLITDPMLGSLANNGGPTPTMLPRFGSPAIDGADPSVAASVTTDQRGYARVVGPAPDIGAVEFQEASPLVTNTADSGPGSLRFASTYSSAGSTITFTPSLSGQSIIFTNGEIDLYQNHTIDGSALSQAISLNGNGSNRMFGIIGSAVTLNSLVLTNGSVPGGSGGAILDEGSLTLNGCTLAGNSGQFAGAIVNYGNCSLVNCTLTGNSAQYNGGAIDNVQGGLTLTQCTLAGNSAGGAGGAIDNYLGYVTAANSIIANNGQDIYDWANSTFILSGANIVEQYVAAGLVVPEGPLYSSDPLLGPLANNGGPTPTMLPLPGSPAINNGFTSFASGITYDQRGPGYPRVVSTAVDIGAVEVQVVIAPYPSLLTGERRTNGVLGFSFTNISGASFTVFGTTNLALPRTSWSNLGPAIESPVGSGEYQFSDPQATNYARRFYSVRSP